MRIAILAVTAEERATGTVLSNSFPESELYLPQQKGQLKTITGDIFHRYEGLIFCMALGIVYRIIAPHIADKVHDPAVVVVDGARRYAISALSGHEGGANTLCYRVARVLGAQAVVTTATESQKKVILGIGCRRGAASEDIKQAIEETLAEHDVDLEEIRVGATVDLKKDETGLIEACDSLGIPLIFIDRDRIDHFCSDFKVSRAAEKHLGLKGVCEPCALLAGRKTKLIVDKVKYPTVTVALAREEFLS